MSLSDILKKQPKFRRVDRAVENSRSTLKVSVSLLPVSQVISSYSLQVWQTFFVDIPCKIPSQETELRLPPVAQAPSLEKEDSFIQGSKLLVEWG